MDSLRFAEAVKLAGQKDGSQGGIGTLGEKTLHAAIKLYLEPHRESHEVKIGGMIADIVGENGVIEIQTGSFTPLRAKLERLLGCTDVTIAYPMAAQKTIAWADRESGEIFEERKSPKKQKPCDAFYELIRIKQYLDSPRLHIKLLMLDIYEIRFAGKDKKHRCKGQSRVDRLPRRLIEEIDIHSPEDYRLFIPQGLAEEYTITDFAKAAAVDYDAAQRALSVLRYLGLVAECPRRGRQKTFKTVIGGLEKK